MAPTGSAHLVLLGLALLAAAAFAQESVPPSPETNGTNLEPYPETDTAPPLSNLLQVDELYFDLLFEGRYDSRRVHIDDEGFGRGDYRQTNTFWSFEESVGLESTGAIGGPELMLFDVAARFGLVQERFNESDPLFDRDQDASGTLLEYDVNLTLFPRGTVSATLFTSRTDSRIPRAFLPSLERDAERYGADVVFNSTTFPMRLRYESTRDVLTSRSQVYNDDELRDEEKLQWDGTWQISEYHALRLEYEYEDRREEYSGSDTEFNTRRHAVTARHTYRFGPEQRSLWEALARFQDETGDLGRDVNELQARLRLQHTPELSTQYSAQWLDETFQSLQSETYRGEIGATYQLDDAFSASLLGYGLQQNANEYSDWTEFGLIATADYTRENDWGQFSANLTYNHASVRTDDARKIGVVVGESQTLRDPLPAILVHQDVNVWSIAVTNRSRTRTYFAGRDYLITRLGRYVGITRLLSGRIQNNETVLVSYTYRVFNNYDLDRDRLTWRLQQDFDNRFSVYYAGSLQDERLSTPQFLRWGARDINRHRLGVTYRQDRWSAGLEYEFNDDDIDPYQAFHLTGDAVLYQTPRQTLDGRAALSYFCFDGENGLRSRDTVLIDLGAGYRYLIAADLEATASALYRFESDDLYGNVNGVDLTTGLRWKIGFFTLNLEAEYDLLDLANSREDTFAVWLRLRREIPVIQQGAL